MSQNTTLRNTRLSFVPLGVESNCDILTNWLKNGETSCNEPLQETNPVPVRPTGRYVLKVWTQGREKVMINVCEARDFSLLEARSVPGGVLLPHVVSRPRDDVDLKKQPCVVVDVTFGHGTLALAERSTLLALNLHGAALHAAQTALTIPIQRDRVSTPKLKCKGTPEPFSLLLEAEPRVEIEDLDTLLKVRFTGVRLTGERLRYHLAQDFLEVDFISHSVVVQLPARVSNLQEEPQLTSNQLVFQLLKVSTKTAKAELFLFNQPVGMAQDPIDHIVRQLDSLKTGMETGGTSSASDEEKAASDNTPEDDYFVDCNQTEEVEQTELEKNFTNNNNINKRHFRMIAAKTRSISESSDDWSMCQSPCKGILKSSYSISGDLVNSYELSELSEETTVENSVNSVKKSVSFSDVISKQLFRADSSILGQRKKNQRKARNKRKSSQRKQQTSESEDVTSEVEKEGQDMMFDIDM